MPVDDRDNGESTSEPAFVDVDIGILKRVDTGGSQTLKCILSGWTAEGRVR